MRILVSGDKHLGLSTDGDSRLEEQERILRFCEDQVQELQPDLYVDLGDLFDRPRPGPAEYALAIGHALAVASMCPAVFLTGNHDKRTRGLDHALLPLAELDEVNRLSVIRIPRDEYLDHETLAMFLPYVTDHEARNGGVFESAQEMLDNHAETTLGEQSAKILVFAHLEVHGASKGEDVRDVGLHVPRCLVESDEVLGIWCGHVHTPQTVGKVTVVGSAIHATFGEVGEEKALVMVEL